MITQRRFLSCNSSKGCPKGVTPLLVTGAAHVGRQDVGLCARDCGVPSRSVAGWSPAWRRTRATTLREKMVSKSRWNRFRAPSNCMRGTACLRVITSGFCAQTRGIPPGELPGAAAPAPAPAPRSAARRRQRTFVDGFLPEKTPKTRDFTLAKTGQKCRKSVQICVHHALRSPALAKYAHFRLTAWRPRHCRLRARPGRDGAQPRHTLRVHGAPERALGARREQLGSVGRRAG